ncbi:MAG: PilZ domain-containing protein [Acidobacteriota bacterium]
MRTDLEGKSRRRHPRMDALGRCMARIGEGIEGAVVNLSLGGMLLRLERILTPGSSYFVKLLFDDQAVVVEARVVRVMERSGDYWAGMEFMGWLSPKDELSLLGFVKV